MKDITHSPCSTSSFVPASFEKFADTPGGHEDDSDCQDGRLGDAGGGNLLSALTDFVFVENSIALDIGAADALFAEKDRRISFKEISG